MSADTSLFSALRNNDFAAAEQAVAAGADVDAFLPELRTTLFHFFLSTGETEKARWLRDRGADINAVDALGDTVLMRAIERNQAREFDLAVEMGVDIDKANLRGVTPVMRAALFPHGKPYLKKLLASGADPNAVSGARTTAVMAAVADGQQEMAEILFEHGADPRGVDEHGQTIFFGAVRSGKPRMLQLVLEKTAALRASGEMDVDYAAGNGSKPIAEAASFSPEMVLMLLRAGADANAQSKNRMQPGTTPLMILAAVDQDGEASLVKEALAAGANPRLRDHTGNNVVAYALSQGLDGKGAVLGALIAAGLDPRAPTGPQALSPLHLALSYEQAMDEGGQPVGLTQLEVISAILAMGFPALPLAWRNPKEPSEVKPLPPPLVVALATKALGAAKLLVEEGGALNDLDDRGVSVLHRMGLVTGMSQEESMAVALTRQQLGRLSHSQAPAATEGADAPPSAADPKRQQRQAKAQKAQEEIEAIEAAGREVVATAAQWLTANGADWSLRDRDGATPLMAIARDNGHLLLGQIVRFHGGDLTLTDPQGRTAADYAFAAEAVDALHAMLAHQARQPEGLQPFAGLLLNAVYTSPEVDGSVPESFARRASFISMLQALPADPALLEGVDEDGNTALMVAAATGQDDVVRTLLALGANPNAVNAAGETALIHAVDQSQPDIVRLLRAAGADPERPATNGTRPRDLATARTSRMEAALSDADPADMPGLPAVPPHVQQRLQRAAEAWERLAPAREDINPFARRRMAM